MLVLQIYAYTQLQENACPTLQDCSHQLPRL